MQNTTYSEKGEIALSLLTKAEIQYPLQVCSDFFRKYSVETIGNSIKKDISTTLQLNLKRLIEASYVMITTQVGQPFASLDSGKSPYTNFLAVIAAILDAKLKVAEYSMNRIIDEHQFRLFAINPEVACHISTFRMIIANCRQVLSNSITNVKFHDNSFSFQPDITHFNLALFVDEVTSPVRLYEDSLGKILEIENNNIYSQLILSDKTMLGVVLSSMLHVAFNHSVKSNMVSLRVHSIDQFLYLSVKSTGKHISDNNIKNLFEPISNTSPLGTTGGANLYLAKMIIEKLRGTIHALSETAETVIQTRLPCLLK